MCITFSNKVLDTVSNLIDTLVKQSNSPLYLGKEPPDSMTRSGLPEKGELERMQTYWGSLNQAVTLMVP